MTNNLKHAQDELRSLSEKALRICDDPKLDVGRKKAALDKLQPLMEAAAAEVDSLKAVDAKRKAWAAAGIYLEDMGSEWPVAPGPAVLSGVDFGGGPLRKNAAPRLALSQDQMHAFHEAVVSHKSFRTDVDTKTTGGPSTGGLLPNQLMPGIVPLSHEPTRVSDHIPSSGMTAPVVEYLRHTATSGTAGMVAPGALKPSVDLTVEKLEARAKKIAVTTTVNDEDLEDFAAFQAWVGAELQRLVYDKENEQILSGDGVGENLQGLLTTTGLITRAKGADPETSLDTVELGITDLRTGPAFAVANLVAMHPTTWSALRRTKDSQGRYLVNPDPTAADGSTLWGLPVVATTGITVGTAAVLNTDQSCAIGWRRGVTVQADYGQTGFEHNQTTIRVEERLALAVFKPAAIAKLTGL